jgi:SAM-dependent methyltransferase
VDTPSVSRVYNSVLGESQNFKPDRDMAARISELIPEARELVMLNRAFLARAIRYCVAQGIDQFIDIGAGIPDAVNTHQLARAVNPDCRVLYLDNEIVTVEVLRDAVADQAGLAVDLMDFRDLPAVYAGVGESALDAYGHPVIDPARPVALLMGLMLHFIPDEARPSDTLADYRRVIAPGSYVAFSHDTADGREQDMRELARLYVKTNRQLILRDRTEITRLFRGYEWIEPGITRMSVWHPDPDTPQDLDPETTGAYVGVVRTPIVPPAP